MSLCICLCNVVSNAVCAVFISVVVVPISAFTEKPNKGLELKISFMLHALYARHVIYVNCMVPDQIYNIAAVKVVPFCHSDRL